MKVMKEDISRFFIIRLLSFSIRIRKVANIAFLISKTLVITPYPGSKSHSFIKGFIIAVIRMVIVIVNTKVRNKRV